MYLVFLLALILVGYSHFERKIRQAIREHKECKERE